MSGDVALGCAERPRLRAAEGWSPVPRRGRRGMAKPRANPPASGRVAVASVLRFGERHRAPAAWVEMDPQGDCLDVARAGSRSIPGLQALDRGPPLGPHPTQAAAERGQPELLAKAREASDADPRPPHHPHRGLREAGIRDIGVRHILEPASKRVQPGAPRGRAVGKAGARRVGERAGAGRRPADQVGEPMHGLSVRKARSRAVVRAARAGRRGQARGRSASSRSRAGS